MEIYVVFFIKLIKKFLLNMITPLKQIKKYTKVFLYIAVTNLQGCSLSSGEQNMREEMKNINN